MSSLNKVQLIGRVGKDPEIRNMQSGDRVASFSLATSEKYKNKAGEPQEKTEWTNIVVFNQHLVKLIESYVSKGSRIYLEGKLQTRKWEKDGQDRYTTEVILNPFNGHIVLLDSKGDTEQRTEPSGKYSEGGSLPSVDEFEDEIPF